MLLSLSLAWGHIPHDQIRGLAVPPDLGTDEPWLLLADPSSAEQFYQSDDGGVTWTYVEPEPYGVGFIAGGRMDNGVWVFATRTSYWYSEDLGTTWTEVSFPVGGSKALVGDTALWYVGSSAVYSVKPGSSPVTELTGTYNWVGARDGGAAAIETGGDAWVYENEEWVELGRPLGIAATAMSTNGKWVGTRSGLFAREDDDWLRCGDLPALGSSGASEAVTGVYVEEPYLVVTLASGGPVVSTDGCETWADVSTPDLPAYDVPGGTESDEEAYTVAVLDGAHWIVGGWAGLYETFTAGISWDDLEPLGPDITTYPTATTPNGTEWVPPEDEEQSDGGPVERPRGEDDLAPTGCAAAGFLPFFLPLALRRRRPVS